MYLSYLDSFWNGDLIDSTYETDCTLASLNDCSNSAFSSPGVFDTINSIVSMEDRENEYVGGNPNGSFTEQMTYYSSLDGQIRSFINDNYVSGSFLGLLMNLGLSYPGVYDYTRVGTHNFVSSFGVNHNVMRSLLGMYASYKGLSSELVVESRAVTDSHTRDSLMAEIKEYLRQGIPLIVGGDTHSGGGHVSIAYYMDDSDVVYCNAGWGNASVCLPLSAVYSQVNDYFLYQISDDYPHSHSYKYIIDSQRYCSCSLVSHSHSFGYTAGNSVYHYYRCYCQNSSTREEHQFFVPDISNNQICRRCGYEQNS